MFLDIVDYQPLVQLCPYDPNIFVSCDARIALPEKSKNQYHNIMIIFNFKPSCRLGRETTEFLFPEQC